MTGCATGTDASDDVRVDLEGSDVAIRIADAEDIEHACEHAQLLDGDHSDYVDITTTSSGTSSSPLTTKHVPYNMTLPGTSTSQNGWVRFVGDNNGVAPSGETIEHGIYTDPSISGVCVRISNAAGTAPTGNCLTLQYQTAISAATCPGIAGVPTYGTSAAISRVRTYNLVEGQLYFVKFSSTHGYETFGLFENLEEEHED